MSISRYFHAATLLADGRVLITGGAISTPQTQTTNTAEIYDPATGSFSVITPMMYNHECQQSVLLNSGQVLLLGGSGVRTGDNHSEVFDPQASGFSLTGPLPPALDNNSCAGAVAAVLADGKVFTISEWATVQIYAPAMQSFAPAGALHLPYSFNDGLPTATLLMDGSVLVAGGYWDAGIYRTAATYDETSGLFTATGNMSTGYDAHTATLLSDGSVLLAGTCYAGISPAPDSDLYDPASRTFSHLSMGTPRCMHTATLLNNGQVLVAGGFTKNQYITTATAELYQPAKVLPAAGLLSQSGDGKGAGAIQHASNYELVTTSNPAAAGEALAIYCTGLIAESVIPPRISIGGKLAQVLWFGAVPQYPGLNQINVIMPAGVAAGDVTVWLGYLGRFSNQVTLSARGN
jgi:Kelch motif